jgi:hypothetical protein
MTAALLQRPGSLAERHGSAVEWSRLDGGATLEELLTSALREARANGSTECPVCRARMEYTRADAREAVCGECGSRLS